MSWPSWLTYSGRFAHINGHPSAAGRARDRESSPVKDQRSTTVLRNQRTYIRDEETRVLFNFLTATAATNVYYMMTSFVELWQAISIFNSTT